MWGMEADPKTIRGARNVSAGVASDRETYPRARDANYIDCLSSSDTLGCMSITTHSAPITGMSRNWTHLIRFLSVERGEAVCWGQPDADCLPEFLAGDALKMVAEQRCMANLIQCGPNDDIWAQGTLSGDKITVAKLLSPVEESKVPIIRCIGLNYRKHSKSTRAEALVIKLIVEYRSINSHRSRACAASVSFCLLQAFDFLGWPRRFYPNSRDPAASTRGRLRGRAMRCHRTRLQRCARGVCHELRGGLPLW